MSKKHYVAMAEAIVAHNAVQAYKIGIGYAGSKPFEKEHLEVIAKVLKEQNPAFSKEKFFGYIEKKAEGK